VQTYPVISKGRPRVHKRTDLLLAVLLTALGASVIIIAVLAATIQKRNESIAGLREKIEGMSAVHPLRYYASHGGNLPIIATSRKALMTSSYVLAIGNQCGESLPLVLTLEDGADDRHKTVTIDVDPRQTAEFSHFDDWKLSEGDIVEISHDGFNSVRMRFR
jgi:hypothetical protein